MSTTRAAYLMARLTTKGLQAGMVFGGRPELERMDIAAACSKLDSLHFHLIMAKYCDDVKSAISAIGELQEFLCRRNQVWSEMDPFRRSRVAASMIQEFISSRKCRSCKGTGETLKLSKIVECPACTGSGLKKVSAHSRAKDCGIPDSTFRSQGLNEPFHDVIRWMDEVETSALDRINRKAS